MDCATNLDFPRLVNQAYSDGARIFIELGAGSNCSRWVDESLKDKPHASFSINRKGLDDHSAVLQLLSKLISHHVQVNLSAILLEEIMLSELEKEIQQRYRNWSVEHSSGLAKCTQPNPGIPPVGTGCKLRMKFRQSMGASISQT